MQFVLFQFSEVNACSDTGCENGGTCEGDTCHCPEDYRGARCQNNVQDFIDSCLEKDASGYYDYYEYYGVDPFDYSYLYDY